MPAFDVSSNQHFQARYNDDLLRDDFRGGGGGFCCTTNDSDLEDYNYNNKCMNMNETCFLWKFQNDTRGYNDNANNNAAVTFPKTPAATIQTNMSSVHVANQKEQESIIARAMLQLSVKEREQVYDDIHGIVSDIEGREDPQHLSKCLEEMKKELVASYLRLRNPTTWTSSTTTTATTTSGYQIAMEQDTNYVLDGSLLTSFLRAEEYNVKKAIKRMMMFFDQKLEIWGSTKLCRDITLEDFKEDPTAMNCLTSGFIQIVPLRDQSGRSIVLSLRPLLPPSATPNDVVKALYYTLMTTIVKNDNIQKHGIIELGYHHSQLVAWGDAEQKKAPSTGPEIMNRIQQLRSTMPIKAAAIHVCTDDPTITFLFKLTSKFMDLQTITRVRIHTGKWLEVQYDLLSCGVPLAALPVDSQGQCKLEYHRLWLQQRQAVEARQRQQQKISQCQQIVHNLQKVRSQEDADHQQHQATQRQEHQAALSDKMDQTTAQLSVELLNSATKLPVTKPAREANHEIIYNPRPNDVLLGRGKHCDQHVGNILFRKYLQQHRILHQYKSVSKSCKRPMADLLRRELQDKCDMRFLTQVTNPNSSTKKDGVVSSKVTKSEVGWVVADSEKIREKISRTCRRLLEMKKKATS